MLLTLLIMQLTGCSPQDKANVMVRDNEIRSFQCLPQQSQCQFDLAIGQIDVLFDVEKIVAEQSFNMQVNFHGAETLTNITGYLEGVDMFMGKIPLFIEQRKTNAAIDSKVRVDIKQPSKKIAQRKQTFQAEVLVGSCSAQQMTWRIWLTFTTNENKNYRKMLTVVSYRS